jgi:hypothetical protein
VASVWRRVALRTAHVSTFDGGASGLKNRPLKKSANVKRQMEDGRLPSVFTSALQAAFVSICYWLERSLSGTAGGGTGVPVSVNKARASCRSTVSKPSVKRP